MRRFAKLYDTTFGLFIGAAVTLLATGHHNGAMVVAVAALVLRFTLGRYVCSPISASED